MINRFIRLLLPTWIFLTFFFIISSVFAELGVISPIKKSEIISSYLLLGYPLSIGYVWVIRIFIMIGILTPFWLRISCKIRHNWMELLLFAALLILQQVLVNSLSDYSNCWFIRDWLLYAIGYSAIFVLGIFFKDKTSKTGIFMFCFVLISFIFVISFNDDGFNINDYKYPPQLVFLLWGALISISLWLTKRLWSNILNNRFIVWLGQNTIWIYFWHIPFLKPAASLLGECHWTIRYLFVLMLAIAIFSIQFYIVSRLKSLNSERRKYLLKYFVG